MAVKRLLNIRPQYDDGNGALASNYRLFFYAAGSSTKQNTYSSSAGTSANLNPIVLNALGEPPVEIWGTVGQTYKIGLAIAGSDDPPASFIWTEDNVAPINDTTVSVDQWVSGPAPTFVSATSFTVSGDQTSTFHKGRRLKTTNTGGTVYSTITAAVFGALTTVTVVNDSSTLDSGLSAVSYSLVTATNPSIDADMVNRKGTAVVSATTTDIWGIAGDYVHITGTTTITGLGTAPYAGARREVIFDGILTLTHNATTLALPGGANITTAANDRMIVRADTTANMVVLAYIKASGLPARATQPTRQVKTTGSGTYTTPTNCTRINVRLIGAGAGGTGNAASAGAAGGNTTFDTLTGSGAAGVAGGAASGGDINIPGGAGGGVGQTATANTFMQGGHGGNGAFGGGGSQGTGNASGGNGATNSGAGGGGGGGASGGNSGSGGGAGGYVEKLITAPAATYSYGVGAGGSGTSGTASTGGTGAAGIIIVDEWYD